MPGLCRRLTPIALGGRGMAQNSSHYASVIPVSYEL